MLWLDMGLGKTIITLSTVAHLLNQGVLKSVLVVAPLRPLKGVWRQQALEWAQTKHLTFSLISGTPDQRFRALNRKANVYLINNENLKWLSDVVKKKLIDNGKDLPFNGIVWDEVTKMKNSTSKRSKAVLPIVAKMDWITGLTGTPASNGFPDLHGQFLVVDKGQRLGVYKTHFLENYFSKDGYKLKPHNFSLDEIKQKIGDITLEMSAEEYNKLPDMVINDLLIELPDELRADYDGMEKEFFLQLDAQTHVEIFNKASLTNKCLQFSNGAMYLEAGKPEYHVIHDLKLDALEDIIDSAQGNPVLCSYAYKSDADRIMKKFKSLNPINLTACKSDAQLNNAMKRWQSGDCPLMIGHPLCLAADTEVLTELRGWVKITEVLQTDKVFDGVEYVTHDGCSYSGYEKTIELFGITMTPNHKILVDGEWKEARHVQNTEKNKRKSLYKWQTPSNCGGGMFTMWQDSRVDTSKCHKVQSSKEGEKSGTEECQKEKRTHVYDLVNCGPRNRFLIRNKEGEMFISHNSMGHGIDGLQKTGFILVWFGLTWSLDLYSQFNARIRRQGQKKPVVCHRIFTKDTLDQAQAMALDEKAAGENSLRKAIGEYRRMKYG
jgi:SNF2 family DNA or RNA helicase